MSGRSHSRISDEKDLWSGPPHYLHAVVGRLLICGNRARAIVFTGEDDLRFTRRRFNFLCADALPISICPSLFALSRRFALPNCLPMKRASCFAHRIRRSTWNVVPKSDTPSSRPSRCISLRTPANNCRRSHASFRAAESVCCTACRSNPKPSASSRSV